MLKMLAKLNGNSPIDKLSNLEAIASTIITVLIGLYAVLLGPELPPFIKNLFNNTFFRIAILFLVVVRGNTDPGLAIIISIAFVLTLQFINTDKFTNITPNEVDDTFTDEEEEFTNNVDGFVENEVQFADYVVDAFTDEEDEDVIDAFTNDEEDEGVIDAFTNDEDVIDAFANDEEDEDVIDAFANDEEELEDIVDAFTNDEEELEDNEY